MLLRNGLLGGALFAGLLFGGSVDPASESGGGASAKAKNARPMWVVEGKIFDNPWVAQEYLAALQAKQKPVADRKPALKDKPKPEGQRQFLVLPEERIEIDLSRFSYADEMARDSIEAHMQLARIIVEERDAQVALIMAMAVLDD